MRGDKVIIPNNCPKPGEVYKHYKGDLYRICFIAEHNDPDEICIIYEAIYENPDFPYFSRLFSSWFEVIKYNGKEVSRFCLQK